jgi:hypothetical protein
VEQLIVAHMAEAPLDDDVTLVVVSRDAQGKQATAAAELGDATLAAR